MRAIHCEASDCKMIFDLLFRGFAANYWLTADADNFEATNKLLYFPVDYHLAYTQKEV